ncbi:MAG TPA: hypothetical protein VL527_00055 [Dongiaceae bacterium]|jgi:uncharacterized integral membrane protein|nr:hypothetical protein [Dongiaceae bacterium]
MTSAALAEIKCPKCGAAFPPGPPGLRPLSGCLRCGKLTQVLAFPALDRPASRGSAGELVVTEGEATCFYHPQKRAHVPCDACGRFICAMCDLEVSGQHLCPQCLETGAKKGKIKTLERSRTRWDQIVLSLLALPLLIYFIVPATSLAALVILGWQWKKPGSLVAHTRWRFIICGVIAIMEFSTSSIFWWMMLTHSGMFGK